MLKSLSLSLSLSRSCDMTKQTKMHISSPFSGDCGERACSDSENFQDKCEGHSRSLRKSSDPTKRLSVGKGCAVTLNPT